MYTLYLHVVCTWLHRWLSSVYKSVLAGCSNYTQCDNVEDNHYVGDPH